VAEVLGLPTGVSVPHAAVHAAPPDAIAHVTPWFKKSFVSDALTVIGWSPVKADGNLFRMVTVRGGVIMLKLKLSFFVASATEVAVIVGEAFAAEGGVAGGW